jgi:hypothetical protein
MRLNGRLESLEKWLLAGECPAPIFTYTRLTFSEAEALPPAEDVPPCPRCGRHHETEIVEVVVESREQALRLQALWHGR